MMTYSAFAADAPNRHITTAEIHRFICDPFLADFRVGRLGCPYRRFSHAITIASSGKLETTGVFGGDSVA
jgi:hypothetical protein